MDVTRSRQVCEWGLFGQAQPAGPEVGLDREVLERLLPPYRVILHNDDHNTMDHVVRSLLKTVPHLTRDEAVAIMLEAHNSGQATVIECRKEAAEHYRDGLERCGLTATIEAA
ncbi:MAG: hypothetical protein Kow0010_10980 [Dehalococcoidia bacterium]